MIIKFFRQIFFPTLCLCCGDEISGFDNQICFSCYHFFENIDNNFCKKCGYKFSFEGESNFICGDCSRIEFSFEFSRSCFVYNEVIKKLILNIKYNDETFAVNFIAENIYNLIIKNKIEFDILISVPMFKEDLIKRTYNQSALFGLYLIKKFKNKIDTCDKIFIPDLLIKTKKTRKLSSLCAEDRIKINHNIIFNDKYLDIIKNKRILILDDIMTTGSTLNACSNAIKKLEKNNSVYCATFARTTL